MLVSALSLKRTSSHVEGDNSHVTSKTFANETVLLICWKGKDCHLQTYQLDCGQLAATKPCPTLTPSSRNANEGHYSLRVDSWSLPPCLRAPVWRCAKPSRSWQLKLLFAPLYRTAGMWMLPSLRCPVDSPYNSLHHAASVTGLRHFRVGRILVFEGKKGVTAGPPRLVAPLHATLGRAAVLFVDDFAFAA